MNKKRCVKKIALILREILRSGRFYFFIWKSFKSV
nr:MAG TPA: hypothetical protein [Caudoviricetes sp.]